MDAEKIKRQLQFLLETDRMKNIERRNLIADGSRRETTPSTAGTWRCLP